MKEDKNSQLRIEETTSLRSGFTFMESIYIKDKSMFLPPLCGISSDWMSLKAFVSPFEHIQENSLLAGLSQWFSAPFLFYFKIKRRFLSIPLPWNRYICVTPLKIKSHYSFISGLPSVEMLLYSVGKNLLCSSYKSSYKYNLQSHTYMTHAESFSFKFILYLKELCN